MPVKNVFFRHQSIKVAQLCSVNSLAKHIGTVSPLTTSQSLFMLHLISNVKRFLLP